MRRLMTMFVAIGAMAGAADPASAAPTGRLPAGMTAWSMFLGADSVVKAVMILLVVASVATWAIAIAKYLEFRSIIRRMRGDRKKLDSVATLAAVPPLSCSTNAALLGAGRDEIDNCVDLSDSRSVDAMTERLSVRLSTIEADAIQALRSGFSVLASIGATAPFVGLFGTVWGIMNSFIGISRAQTTNLAVVAPGIAEALLATSLGLVAAIPAVLLYNIFSRRMASLRRHLHNASARVACLVSHDAERAQVGHLKVAV